MSLQVRSLATKGPMRPFEPFEAGVLLSETSHLGPRSAAAPERLLRSLVLAWNWCFSNGFRWVSMDFSWLFSSEIGSRAPPMCEAQLGRWGDMQRTWWCCDGLRERMASWRS